jgi:hypothetical protein
MASQRNWWSAPILGNKKAMSQQVLSLAHGEGRTIQSAGKCRLLSLKRMVSKTRFCGYEDNIQL